MSRYIFKYPFGDIASDFLILYEKELRHSVLTVKRLAKDIERINFVGCIASMIERCENPELPVCYFWQVLLR